MDNIFENAYFGKVYKTRDEWRAIYIDCEDNDFNSHPHRLLIEGTKLFVFYNDFGTAFSSSSDDDIISEWYEEIDEKELDELANQDNPYEFYGYYETQDSDRYHIIFNEGFKAGYRKAEVRIGKN